MTGKRNNHRKWSNREIRWAVDWMATTLAEHGVAVSRTVLPTHTHGGFPTLVLSQCLFTRSNKGRTPDCRPRIKPMASNAVFVFDRQHTPGSYTCACITKPLPWNRIARMVRLPTLPVRPARLARPARPKGER